MFFLFFTDVRIEAASSLVFAVLYKDRHRGRRHVFASDTEATVEGFIRGRHTNSELENKSCGSTPRREQVDVVCLARSSSLVEELHCVTDSLVVSL